MGTTPAIKAFHERRLIQPVLQYRLRPFWSRMTRVPQLYRHYRSLGLIKADALRLAIMVLRSPRLLAKVNLRWGARAQAAQRGRGRG